MMRKHLLAGVAVLYLASPAVAHAQQTPSPEPAIVVTAPKGLSDKAEKEWAKLNKQARKLGERLEDLREEARDDVNDVAEAREALEDARDKLEDELDDQRDTAKKLEKAQADLEKINTRRTVLRAAR